MNRSVHSTSSAHYAALELQHVVALTTLSSDPAEFLVEFHDRQVDFISSLINTDDERLTVDLRIISYPDRELYTRGHIRLALICKMEHATAEETAEVAEHIRLYLEAHFPEYGFSYVPAGEIEKFLDPFPIQVGVEIIRRCERVQLDTLRNDLRGLRTIGFTSDSPTSSHRTARTQDIIHIAPFILTQAGFERLFTMLLLQPMPVIISVMLRPATLTVEEAAFIEDQITQCERFAQVGLDRVSDPVSLHAAFPTLQEQARSYQRSLARMLATLQAAAALVQIRVASAERSQARLVHSVASLITEAAGGTQLFGKEGEMSHHSGGYDVLEANAETLPALCHALSTVTLAPMANPVLPVGVHRLVWLFEPIDAACAFRLPPPPADILPGVPTRSWRTRMVPPSVPAVGTLMGISEDTRASQRVHMTLDDRRRHVYIIGQTGTGKTTLMKSMILSDIRDGQGLCVIDPHGDMFKEVLGSIPSHRVNDVVVFDPTDTEFPIGLNLLECQSESERHFIAAEMVAIINKLIADEYGAPAAQNYTGPMFYQHVRNNLLLTMSNSDDPGTLLQFYMIFQEKDFWQRWLPLKTSDPILERWVKNALPRTDYTRPGFDGTSFGSYIGSKFEQFVFDPLLRNIFGQQRSTVNLGAVMDEGKILLVNLAKGEMTEANSRFLGLVVMAKLQAAVMERARIEKEDRRDFNIYVDEFQSIATQNFATLLSEGRKFRVNLTLATQFITQVDPHLIGSILGNVGTIVCFRLGQLDAEQMEKEFFPFFNRYDLMNLPNWNAYMTTLMHGQAVTPFSIRTTVEQATTPSKERAQECRVHSQKTYGRPVREVEAEVAKSVEPVPAPPMNERELP
jgi:hypothetical protein